MVRTWTGCGARCCQYGSGRQGPERDGGSETAGARCREDAWHAVHHVTFFDRSSGIAFVGDTAGIRRETGRKSCLRLPPTSTRGVAGQRGSYSVVDLTRSFSRISAHFVVPGRISGALQAPGRLECDGPAASGRSSIDEAERERRFVEEVRQDIRRTVGRGEAEQYAQAGAWIIRGRGLPVHGSPGSAEAVYSLQP